jgi:hypothetical protein
MGHKRLTAVLRPPAELRRAGIDVLVKALGPVGMARFLQLFGLGKGDYTIEREGHFGEPYGRRTDERVGASTGKSSEEVISADVPTS